MYVCMALWNTVTVIFLLLGKSCFATLSSSPHIVFILADDLGWNDVGFHNPDIITPNIDHLANNGIKLNQSYVQPLCSPSRAAIMTGVYPFRLGLQHEVIEERQQVCAPTDRPFLPEALKTKGYATHMVGKWHLGFCSWYCTPTYRGFDSFYGYYSAAETFYSKTFFGRGYDFRSNECVDKSAAGNYSTFQYAERVKQIIQDHKPEQPLFLYLPFQSVHMPLEVPEKYLRMYPNVKPQNRQILSAMVTAMDDAIGEVVQTLKDNGLYNDTLIIFSPDNGGWTVYGASNIPLRGGKISLFEGGTRVAAFMHGKILNNSGVTYDGLMHAVDWFPTLAEAAGVNITIPDQDGVSQWSAITSLAESPRNEMIYNLDFDEQPIQGQAAIRVGDYKLLEGFPGLYSDWYKPNDTDQGINITFDDRIDDPAFEKFWNTTNLYSFRALYNVKDDPEERHNLYDSRPDIVSQLQVKMASYKQKYVKPDYPNATRAANPKYWGDVWAPGWCNTKYTKSRTL